MKKVLISGIILAALLVSFAGFAQSGDSFSIVYNNIPSENHLRTDWGFAVWIEKDNKVILFDTGNKPDILEDNFEKMGMDPGRISAIVISHEHYDHTGGLEWVLKQVKNKTKVYLSNDYKPGLKKDFPHKRFIINDRFREIAKGVWITEVFVDRVRGIREQALVLVKKKKLIVITG